ncbi:TPA: AbiH family protein [Streptococcus suis]|uniref:AbiH family protein n=1 Tax=Streptococcus suis TaxID=1307 RepID=UPI001F6085D0|nr:AbiH family protein [Streptococcus suis]
MAENILILGNGFDLAMGRKTSYGDFLKFSRSVSVLKKYVLKDTNDYSLENVSQNYQRIITRISEALDDLKSEFSDKENEKILSLSNFKKFFLMSDYLYYEVKNSLPIDILDFSLSNDPIANTILSRGVVTIKNSLKTSQLYFDVESIAEILSNVEKKDFEWLFKLPDNIYVRFLEENKDLLGKNWSNIEHAISSLAEAIMELKHSASILTDVLAEENVIQRNSKLESVKSKFADSVNHLAICCVLDLLKSESICKSSKLSVLHHLDAINESMISELEKITDYLEFYLTYLDKIDFEIQKIRPASTALDAIQNIEKSKVITFNYTNTASEMLGVTEENTHFIHGRCQFNRSDDDINTMVFGIEDKEAETENIHQDLIPFQKFYQRAVKETGSKFENFFENTLEFSDDWVYSASKNIIIFGHSVDPLDKEIFKACFDLAHEGGYAYKFIFTFLDEVTKRNIVKNLAIILGKRKLVELTGRGNIVFVKSYDIDQMRKELLN